MHQASICYHTILIPLNLVWWYGTSYFIDIVLPYNQEQFSLIWLNLQPHKMHMVYRFWNMTDKKKAKKYFHMLWARYCLLFSRGRLRWWSESTNDKSYLYWMWSWCVNWEPLIILIHPYYKEKMFRNGLPKQSIQELEDIHWSKCTTSAPSEVSGALSVLSSFFFLSFFFIQRNLRKCILWVQVSE